MKDTISTIADHADKGVWITFRMLRGHIAMWAVRLSPYPCPDNLAEVLQAFQDTARRCFDDNGMGNLNRAELCELLDKHLLSQPYVQAWNNRKNGNDAPYQFVSTFSGEPHPDNDFIDLDALLLNIVRSTLTEP